MKRRRTVDWLWQYAAKDMQENHLQSSLHLCLYNNHIVAPPHKIVEHGRQERTKFSNVCSRRTKTNVLQSIPSNSFTVTYPLAKIYD